MKQPHPPEAANPAIASLFHAGSCKGKNFRERNFVISPGRLELLQATESG